MLICEDASLMLPLVLELDWWLHLCIVRDYLLANTDTWCVKLQNDNSQHYSPAPRAAISHLGGQKVERAATQSITAVHARDATGLAAMAGPGGQSAYPA